MTYSASTEKDKLVTIASQGTRAATSDSYELGNILERFPHIAVLNSSNTKHRVTCISAVLSDRYESEIVAIGANLEVVVDSVALVVVEVGHINTQSVTFVTS